MNYTPQLDKLKPVVEKYIGALSVVYVVEVGARDGKETVELARTYPHAQVHTFECNPNTMEEWRSRVSEVGAIPHIMAVSDVTGPVDFYPINKEKSSAGNNQGASSLLKASGKYKPETYIQDKITVQSITLSDFMNYWMEWIDLLWIDIQGGELKAFEGAGDRIKDIAIIHTEVEFMEIYEKQPLFKDVKKYLNQKGFYLQSFTAFGPYAGDCIFLNKQILKYKSYHAIRDRLVYPFNRVLRILKQVIKSFSLLEPPDNFIRFRSRYGGFNL